MFHPILKVTSRVINLIIKAIALIKQKPDIKSIKIKITNKPKIENHPTINERSVR
jgi:hypothetical protein